VTTLWETLKDEPATQLTEAQNGDQLTIQPFLGQIDICIATEFGRLILIVTLL